MPKYKLEKDGICWHVIKDGVCVGDIAPKSRDDETLVFCSNLFLKPCDTLKFCSFDVDDLYSIIYLIKDETSKRAVEKTRQIDENK